MNNMPLFSLENPCACSCHKCKYLHTSPRPQLNMYKMTKACNHKLHNRQARACTAASGSGPPVFIDDGSADRSSRTNCKVYRAILSAHIQRNATKLIRLSFTVQMDNDPKRTAKATREFLEAKTGYSSLAKSVILSPDSACF